MVVSIVPFRHSFHVRCLIDEWGVDEPDLSECTLTVAQDISADGSVIVGLGIRNGQKQGWVVVIPEPSTIVLLAIGTVGLLAYAWRKRRR